MNDIEINKALAKAIGWAPSRVIDKGQRIVIIVGYLQAREFDYMDWAVIGPIAERYNAFPTRTRRGVWFAGAIVNDRYGEAVADTPQKAIALAVLQGARK